MLYILCGFFPRQRLEVIAAGNPLRELAKIIACQEFAQLGLADKDDLQQFLFCRFEVSQQAHLLQHRRRQVLRFVDDQDRTPAFRVRLEKMVIERVRLCLDAALVVQYVDVQFFADRCKELEHRQLRVQHHRHVRIVRHSVLQQRANEGGFAGTDFAGQLDESAALGYAVHQVCERFPMTLAHEQVARIRGNRKRLFIQPEEAGVHASPQRVCFGPDSTLSGPRSLLPSVLARLKAAVPNRSRISSTV